MLKSAGRFIFIPMTTKFPKGFLTPQEHITLLKNRGLLFEGKEQKAATYLKNIGYYRLSAYFYPLLQTPKEQHIFKQGSSFRNVMNMYRFDRKFRVLVFNEVEKIEVAFRSCITNMASEAFNDIFWMTDPQYFADTEKFNSSMAAINSELDKTKEDFIKHFKKDLSNEKSSLIIKALCVIFVICSYIIANTDTAILDMMSYSWGIISGSFLAPYVVALYWKKMNTKGAWAGILGGFFIAIVPAAAKILTSFTANETVVWLAGKGPVFACIAMLASLALCFAVSAVTKSTNEKETEFFYSGDVHVDAVK